MKNKYSFILLSLLVLLSSCEVVGGIFKAGMWAGILIVVIVIAIIIWLFNRGRRS